MEQFTVYVRRWGNLYRIQVAITYRSANVIRFKISGGTRYIEAEKRLFLKKDQWKLGKRNFNTEGNNKDHARVMREILWEIEAWLKGKRHPVH